MNICYMMTASISVTQFLNNYVCHNSWSGFAFSTVACSLRVCGVASHYSVTHWVHAPSACVSLACSDT